MPAAPAITPTAAAKAFRLQATYQWPRRERRRLTVGTLLRADFRFDTDTGDTHITSSFLRRAWASHIGSSELASIEHNELPRPCCYTYTPRRFASFADESFPFYIPRPTMSLVSNYASLSSTLLTSKMPPAATRRYARKALDDFRRHYIL